MEDKLRESVDDLATRDAGTLEVKLTDAVYTVSRRSTETAVGGNRSKSATASAAPTYIEMPPTTNRTGAGTRVAAAVSTCAQRSRRVRSVYTCRVATSPPAPHHSLVVNWICRGHRSATAMTDEPLVRA